MITLKIWQALQQPPPAHWARWKKSEPPKSKWRYLVYLILGPFMLVSLILASAIPGINIMVGTGWALQTLPRMIRGVQKEDVQHSLTLLKTMPDGELGVNWRMFGWHLHYERSGGNLWRPDYLWLRWTHRFSVITTPFIGLLFCLGIGIEAATIRPELWDQLLVTLSVFIALWLMVYLSGKMGMGLSALGGVLIARHIESGMISIFNLAALIIAYGIYIVTGLSVWAGLSVLRDMGLYETPAISVVPLIAVLVFVGLHEGLARLIWAILPASLNASTDDVRRVLNVG